MRVYTANLKRTVPPRLRWTAQLDRGTSRRVGTIYSKDAKVFGASVTGANCWLLLGLFFLQWFTNSALRWCLVRVYTANLKHTVSSRFRWTAQLDRGTPRWVSTTYSKNAKVLGASIAGTGCWLLLGVLCSDLRTMRYAW